MNRFFSTLVLVAASLMLVTLPTMAQSNDKAHMFGLIGGVAFTSNPPALQNLTGKSHYVDGNGGFTYLYHNNVTDGYAFEWQLSFIGSSVNTLESADNETKVKFIVPLDFRWFLGNYQKIQAYIGLGLQYNTVWLFKSGDYDENIYYNPWWGDYYTETTQGEDTWDWTVNQLSTNVAVGIKVPFWNIYMKGVGDVKMHNIILGLKGHFPIINASEHHGDENRYVDLSRDKVNVSITGGISFGFKNGNAIKIDGEYPIGGSNKYTVNDGGHATFFNTHSWSLSATLLFRLPI